MRLSLTLNQKKEWRIYYKDFYFFQIYKLSERRLYNSGILIWLWQCNTFSSFKWMKFFHLAMLSETPAWLSTIHTDYFAVVLIKNDGWCDDLSVLGSTVIILKPCPVGVARIDGPHHCESKWSAYFSRRSPLSWRIRASLFDEDDVTPHPIRTIYLPKNQINEFYSGSILLALANVAPEIEDHLKRVR